MRKLVSLLLALMMLMSVMNIAVAEEPFVITVHVPYYADVEPVGCTGEEGNPVPCGTPIAFIGNPGDPIPDPAAPVAPIVVDARFMIPSEL